MLQRILIGPPKISPGWRFLRDVRQAGRKLYVWTVNDEKTMRWSIRKGVDGVITDDPVKFLEVCREYKGKERAERWTLKEIIAILNLNFWAMLYSWMMSYKYGFRLKVEPVVKKLEK
jgi:phosphatidylglycerol phospholipase C